MIYYCDNSAVAKLYLEETGSAFMKSLYRSAPSGDIFINVIAGPEVLAALYRRFRNNDLPSEVLSQACADFEEDFADFFNRIPVAAPIIHLAMHLITKHPLRGYDSVQLATALHLQNVLRASNGRDVVFVGADKILNGAAKNEGLTVINPNEQS